MKTTTVINLYGGPGCGKSTTAAAVFAELKQRMFSVELVREYVKEWAWRGHKVGEWDQVYLFAKQLRAESALYGQVDYLITDSPLGLCKVYEPRYQPGVTTCSDLHDSILERQRNAGIRHLDVILARVKPYVNAGRYETEAQAREIDEACREAFPAAVACSSIAEVVALIEGGK